MKTLMTALTLVTLLTAPAFVQSANAQRPGNGADAARERAIQECMAMNKKDSHDPYGSTGGVEHHYAACMATKGQPQ
jgi:hypothetical protein